MARELERETVPFDADDVSGAAGPSPAVSGKPARAAWNESTAGAPGTLPPGTGVSGSADGSVAESGRARESPEERPDERPDELPGPGDTIGHYELIRELGHGGMGVVYLARDLELARRVAIKFVRAGNPALTERFVAEARATARCHHENIVIIHDIAEHRGNPYMVLEYLQGRMLRDLVTGKSLSPERAVELVLPVVRALERAHQHGIVHRDLKPENILVTDAGAVKVLDFGIAKLLKDSQTGAPRVSSRDSDRSEDGGALIPLPEMAEEFRTSAGVMIGTLPYMSPEQLAARADIDQRADIWAVGIILYELILGRHPLAPITHLKLHELADVDEPMPPVAELMPRAGELGALASLASLIDRCVIKRREDRLATASELLGALEALAPHRATPALTTSESPFTGLAAFQKSDACRFFGRTREVAAVVSQLHSQPLVTLVGPSGAGKSSVVRAGVIPALERSGEGWHAMVVRPGRDPLAALASALDELALSTSTSSSSPSPPSPPSPPSSPSSPLDPAPDSSLAARLRRHPGLFGQELRAWARRKRRRIVVFVDQFEELYTLVPASDVRPAFMRCLEGAADDASSPLRVILSIRSDFLDRVVEDSQFSGEVSRGLVLLPPMGRDGLRDALTRPVEAADHGFESDELVDDMLDALAATSVALPLLQFTASKLWDARDQERKLLTRACYQGFGGVAGALAGHGDAVLAGMSAVRLGIARSIFERLVTPERTRAVVTLGELRELPGDPDAIEQVVHHLADSRLLAIESGAEQKAAQANSGEIDLDALNAGVDRAASDSTVELIHESLIERWPTLRRWLDESYEDAEFLARLRGAARQWHDSDRQGGTLWRGEAARRAREWREHYGGQLIARDEQFLDAVVAQLGRSERVKRYTIAAVAAACVVLAVSLVVSLYFNRESTIQRERAEDFASRSAAARAEAEASATKATQRLVELYVEQGRQTLLDGDPMRAFVYLLEALRTGADDRAVRFLLARARDALEGQEMVLAAHDGWVMWAEFSPDGERIATCGTDGTAKIWDVATGERVATLSGHDDTVWMLDFSPDGEHIATAGWDRTVRVWDADTGEALWSARHDGRVQWVGYAAGGDTLATASMDRTARIWNARTGEPIARFDGQPASRAALDPRGTFLVTGSLDGSVHFWNLKTRKRIRTFEGQSGYISDIQVSADGARVAIASVGGLAWIIPADGRPVRTLAGHVGRVGQIRFSPDGTRVVTAGEDYRAKVWDAATGAHLFDLEGHTGGVTSAEFSPDGRTVVTASRDQTLRTWDVTRQAPIATFVGHPAEIWLAEFNADGSQIVSAGFDGTVRLWNGRETPYLRAFDDHARPVLSATPSPTGDRVATAQSDGTVQVWTLGGERLLSLEAGAGQGRVQWSPDGERLLVSRGLPDPARPGTGSGASIWNARSGDDLVRITGHQGKTIMHAAHDAQGTRIVTTGDDGSAVIRDAVTGEAQVTLTGHRGPVLFAAFDPAGNQLVTAGMDGTARSWHAHAGHPRAPPLDHEMMYVSTARFSADGRLVVTASQDSIARIWTREGVLKTSLEGHTGVLNSAVFGDDDRLIVTASHDGTVRIWDARSGKHLWSIDHHRQIVWSIEPIPGSARVITASGTRAAVWRLDHDERDLDTLAAFARCRIPYILKDGSLEPIRIAHDRCRGRDRGRGL